MHNNIPAVNHLLPQTAFSPKHITWVLMYGGQSLHEVETLGIFKHSQSSPMLCTPYREDNKVPLYELIPYTMKVSREKSFMVFEVFAYP